MRSFGFRSFMRSNTLTRTLLLILLPWFAGCGSESALTVANFKVPSDQLTGVIESETEGVVFDVYASDDPQVPLMVQSLRRMGITSSGTFEYLVESNGRPGEIIVRANVFRDADAAATDWQARYAGYGDAVVPMAMGDAALRVKHRLYAYRRGQVQLEFISELPAERLEDFVHGYTQFADEVIRASERNPIERLWHRWLEGSEDTP